MHVKQHTEVLQVRLSEEKKNMLMGFAKIDGMNGSQVIRRLVDQYIKEKLEYEPKKIDIPHSKRN